MSTKKELTALLAALVILERRGSHVVAVQNGAEIGVFSSMADAVRRHPEGIDKATADGIQQMLKAEKA